MLKSSIGEKIQFGEEIILTNQKLVNCYLAFTTGV